MLPFSFINPNKNRLFLLYTMLKATYKDNTYTFYVTLKDAEQYKNSLLPFPVLPFFNTYLIKFTNDMSGAIKFAYAQNVIINDRYAKFEIFNGEETALSIFDGIVNFDETGYWKYEIFWIWLIEGFIDCNRFNPLQKGTWNCYDSTNATIDKGNLSVDNYTISNLSASVYDIQEFSTCYPPPVPYAPTTQTFINTISTEILDRECVRPRLLLFTKVEQNIDTASFTMETNIDVGQEVRFISTKRNYSYIIKTKPEVVVMTVETGTGTEDAQEYTVEVSRTDGSTEPYNNVIAVRKPQQYRGGYIMASNNEYSDSTPSCGNGLAAGNIIFTWNGTGNSPNSGYITPFEAPIEIGKLLIEEPIGDEQVRYKQHESPTDTNYIYND